MLYVLVVMSELTAVAKYINYWWPHIPAWTSVLFFFVVITAINLNKTSKFYVVSWIILPLLLLEGSSFRYSRWIVGLTDWRGCGGAEAKDPKNHSKKQLTKLFSVS